MSAPHQNPHVRHVDPKTLALNHALWQNPRTVTGLDKASLKEFAAEVRSRGIFTPLIVQKVTNGDGNIHDLVLDGQRRTLGAIEAGLETVPVVDHWPDPITLDEDTATKLMLDVLSAGHHREGLSSYEQSEVAVKLRKQTATHAQIGKAIGRDTSWVSRFLAARQAADAKLLDSWKTGKLTDEQFKDLASVPAGKQLEAMEEIVETRKEGGRSGKAEARARVKEMKAKATSKKKGKAAKVVSGPQMALPIEEAKAKPVSKVMLEEMVAMSAKSSPIHDYVKGLMDGVKYALGLLEPSAFGRAWKTYLSRLPSGGRKAAAAGRGSRAKTTTTKAMKDQNKTSKKVSTVAEGTKKRKELTPAQRAEKNAKDRARRAAVKDRS